MEFPFISLRDHHAKLALILIGPSMTRILISWVGKSDYKAAQGRDQGDPGPVLRLLKASADGRIKPFDRFCFLSDLPQTETGLIANWLASSLPVYGIDLDSFERFDRCLENDYSLTYSKTKEALNRVLQSTPDSVHRHVTFLLAPGTPAMQLSMVVVAAGLEEDDSGYLLSEVLTTSREKDVETVSLPFQLRVDLNRNAARKLMSAPSLPINANKAFDRIHGKSSALEYAKKWASRLSMLGTEAILLHGETGTGKELFAKAIHEASHRNKGPYVSVNCAAIADSLFESEMFGSRAGAFTGSKKDRPGVFEQADGGTLFLDEIGELALHNQAKLLRAIQERLIRPVGEESGKETPFDAKIILATHRDLAEMVQNGQFRADLYQRISTFIVEIPPLRKRRGDIELLSKEILKGFCSSYPEATGSITLDDDAVSVLKKHSWSGNIRELQKVIKQLAIIAGKDSTITFDHVSEVIGCSRNVDAPYGNMPDDQLANHLISVMAAAMRRFPDWCGEDAAKKSFVDTIVWPLLVGYLRNDQSLPFYSKNGDSVTSFLGGSKMQENEANTKRLSLYNELKSRLGFDHTQVAQLLGGAES